MLTCCPCDPRPGGFSIRAVDRTVVTSATLPQAARPATIPALNAKAVPTVATAAETDAHAAAIAGIAAGIRQPSTHETRPRSRLHPPPEAGLVRCQESCCRQG